MGRTVLLCKAATRFDFPAGQVVQLSGNRISTDTLTNELAFDLSRGLSFSLALPDYRQAKELIP